VRSGICILCAFVVIFFNRESAKDAKEERLYAPMPDLQELV